jgi:transcriptional regulator with GAF, ATPase, and Fis domain/Tfp pilus assembly protein PilF
VSLSAEPARILASLVEAEQALSAAQIEALGGSETVEALCLLGCVRRDASGAAAAQPLSDARPLSRNHRRRLMEVLATVDADAWSMMRAAELAAIVGEPKRAEELAFAALGALGDAVARQDLWVRWERAFGVLTSGDQLDHLIRSAELALQLGDGERADQLARRAMQLDSGRFDVLLLHGRSSNARGDMTTAALSLTRAMTVARAGGERAQAAGLLAHVRYTAGDPKQAERYANEAIELAEDIETRLEGRNVLGKLLLAREAWAEAEQHFATDAYEASLEGARESELRARLNRAIAILYLGRREKAREILEEVLYDGDAHGEPRAVAFALSNLAAIAILEHRYERALELSERAIEVRRALGGRVGTVQPITNLAELRLQLGLVDEAEQALRFGLSACGQDLPLSRYAYFAKASACIHLARGDTGLASKDVATAISGATCSGELAVLAQCHRIAARIALDDGDLARARSALVAADTMRHTAFGEAELRVLQARALRASGEPFLDAAREALTCAQRSDDPESKREAHVLMCQAYRLAGDEDAALSHLKSALAERDRVAHALPAALRSRYLSRRVLSELAALEANIHELTELEAPPTTRVRPEVLTAPPPVRHLVGDSPAMRALRGTIRRVGDTDATVLIHGETGTGKELVAEAIHRGSRRASGPMVKVNCAALVETLLLSELFGHEKGAFTGASTRRRGRFEVAEGGTLFLDEIGDISPRTQVALLRVLQDGTFERVGGCTQLRANVRIVCATHRDLRAMVERGEFREDLYYRLCGVIIEVPALRERVEDIPSLAQALLAQAERQSGIEARPLSREALRTLTRHNWPGNVRELENALRVAALFARGPEIALSDFTDNVEGLRQLPSRGHPSSVPPPPDTELGKGDPLAPTPSSSDLVYSEVRGGSRLSDMKRRIEQECIARALVDSGGNITRAAALLGMKRPRLSQLVKQYKLATVLEDFKS